MAVAAMCPQWAQAQFSGSGSGTENDPYLIFNPIQLNEVRNYLGNSNVWFKMMYDIDLEEWLADNNPSQGWQPIGNSSSKFKGHFLGMGHRISLSLSGGGTSVSLPVTRIEYTYTEDAEEPCTKRGDTNLDGQVTIGDVTTLIDYLLSGQWPE